MKLNICVAVLIAVCCTSVAYGDHRHGPRNECWRDTKYKRNGFKWAYYYCGAQQAKCDGKKSKGHDKVFWQYHGDKFTFETDQRETYFCCGGTKSAEGKYVRADKWIVDEKIEKVQVSGGTCNKKIQTDACGEVHVVECNEPDNCNAGTTMRNGQCVKPCEDGQVFNGPSSNTCITCDTTPYQGPSANKESCIKCDEGTEFFNRETKTCIKKSSLAVYAKQNFRECWRCPYELRAKCVEVVTAANKQGLSGNARLDAIKALDTVGAGIIEKCHLSE